MTMDHAGIQRSSWVFVYMRNVDIGRVPSSALEEIWESLGVDRAKVACANSIGAFLAEFIVDKDYANQFTRLLSSITTPEPLDDSLSISQDTEYSPLSPYAQILSKLDGMPESATEALNRYAREALTRRWSGMYHAATDPTVRGFIKDELERNSLHLHPAEKAVLGSTPKSARLTKQHGKGGGGTSLKQVSLPLSTGSDSQHRGSGLVHYRPPNHAILSRDHLAELIPQPTDRRFIVYADGAYLPDRGAAGIGVYFENPRIVPLSERLLGHQSNARAEIHAMVAALNRLAGCLALVDPDNGPCEIWICSDSRYAVDGVNMHMEVWEQTGWLTAKGKPVANRKGFQLLQAAMNALVQSGYNIFVHHLPAHAGIQGNEIADMLAKAGALL